MADDGGYSDSNSSAGPDGGSRWKGSKGAKATSSALAGLAGVGQKMLSDSRDEAASNIHAVSYRKGGKTRKNGVANLHKNERVIPANKRKKVERMMKREKISLTNRKGRKKARKASGR